jgi:hypothetical protein
MSVRLHQGFIILAALGVCASAQETTHVMAGGGDVHYFSMQAGPGDKVVKGSPYAAEAVTETVQTLANGIRITHKSTTQLARDSEGRTRREQTLDMVGPWSTSGEAPKFIMLNDPVAGVSYHLDPRTNTAMKMPFAKGAIPPPPHPVSQFFFATAVDGPPSGEAMAKMKAEGMATATISAGGVTPPDAASIAAFKIKDRGEAKTESLGHETIEGMPVIGTRTTRTIAAGAIGNDQPIEVVSETWYSPNLQMVVMSKHSDPQIGETTYKLTNIQQAEPAHSLFEVPANYTVREGEGKPMILEDAPIGATSK